ncbi:stress-induced protein [Xanthobacter dioxanivorans]|uniref:Stress-induced protein n=1 Tax=Xanthobacter dioxanivorans TaxID=2528964 RepID=A0A974PKC8_9HYPH|nr:stress-induced protein [Xanthobacter dioxanivorans]QRG04881.1 stress-induced protein [Xanthobacter dioxanivorans]
MNNRQQGGSGNPTNDRASEAERKRAEEHQQQQDHGRGQQGGGFEGERERASEAGRKSGQGGADDKHAARERNPASEPVRKSTGR